MLILQKQIFTSTSIVLQLAQASTTYCKECPNGAGCKVQSTNLTFLPLSRRILARLARNLNTTPLQQQEGVQGLYKSPSNSRSLPDGVNGIYCAANHTGPLCEVCINDNDYFDQLKGKCTTFAHHRQDCYFLHSWYLS